MSTFAWFTLPPIVQWDLVQAIWQELPNGSVIP